MLLKQLLKGLRYQVVQGTLHVEVADIFYDSRKVTPGGLFVCIVGTQRDSHDYAADVVEKGAAVLVIQHDLAPGVLDVYKRQVHGIAAEEFVGALAGKHHLHILAGVLSQEAVSYTHLRNYERT